MSIPDMAKLIAKMARRHRKTWSGSADTIPSNIEENLANELVKASQNGWKEPKPRGCGVDDYAYNLLRLAIKNHGRWYDEQIATQNARIHPVLLDKMRAGIMLGATLIEILGMLLNHRWPWTWSIIAAALIVMVLNLLAGICKFPRPYRKSPGLSERTRYRIMLGVLATIAFLILIVGTIIADGK